MDQNVKRALVRAIHEAKPPALAVLDVDMRSTMRLETVTVTFHVTPELIKAWGDECAKPQG